MIPTPAASKSPGKFFLYVFLISIPFWVIGTVVDRFLPKTVPIHLPFAAMMFVCPLAVGLFLSYQENGSMAAKQLLKRAFDYAKIKQKSWIIFILLFWPLIMILAYLWMKFTGIALPNLQFPNWMAPVSLILFFIAAAGEELGWMGYAVDPLQERWGALGAGIILGVVWAVWQSFHLCKRTRLPIGSFGSVLQLLRHELLWFGSTTIPVKVYLQRSYFMPCTT